MIYISKNRFSFKLPSRVEVHRGMLGVTSLEVLNSFLALENRTIKQKFFIVFFSVIVGNATIHRMANGIVRKIEKKAGVEFENETQLGNPPPY